MAPARSSGLTKRRSPAPGATRTQQKRTVAPTAGRQSSGGQPLTAAEIPVLQRTAGNRAVNALVGRTIQRAPADAPTIPVGDGTVTRPASFTGVAVPVSDAEVVTAHAADPDKVIRSPRDDWHAQMYRHDVGRGEIPKAFRVGDIIAVHPDHKAVPATELASHSGVEGFGLTPPPPPAAPPPALPRADKGAVTADGVNVTDSRDADTPLTPATRAPQSGQPGAVPPGWAAAVAQSRNNPMTQFAATASRDEAEAAYRQDPNRVMRSVDDHYHEQMYAFSRGKGDPPPVIRVGNLYLVAPDHPGPATPLDPAMTPGTGPVASAPAINPAATPATAGRVTSTASAAHTLSSTPAVQGPGGTRDHSPTSAATTLPASDHSAASGATTLSSTPAIQGPGGTRDHSPASGATTLSSTPVIHGQEGTRDHSPRSAADTLPVNDHSPASGASTLSSTPAIQGPGGTRDHSPASAATTLPHKDHSPESGAATLPPPTAAPTTAPPTTASAPAGDPAKALATVTPVPASTAAPANASYSQDVGKVGKLPALATSATEVKEEGGQVNTTTKKRELGTWSKDQEQASGDVSTRQVTQGGVVVGDGMIAGGQVGRTNTVAVENVGSTSTTTGAQAGLTTDLEAKAGVSHATETTTIDKAGKETKTSTSTTAAATFDGNKAGLNAAHTREGPDGVKKSINYGVSGDREGNTSVQGGAGVENKRGMGAAVSTGAAHTVTAEAPEEVEGGWLVRYVIDDSVSGSASVSASGKGAVPVGIGGGASHSSSDLKTGTRKFATEKEALDFQKHAGSRVGPVSKLPPTTVEGALQIPINESRGIGKSTTSGLSGSVTAGATVTKSASTTKGEETTVRRTGEFTVEVTTIVSGTEASAWGISGLGLTNEKGGSSSTLYEVVFACDLKTPAGQSEFTNLCNGTPPKRKPLLVHKRESRETHDKVTLLGSSNTWGGGTFKDRKETETAVIEEQGGYQSFDATPGRFARALGDKEIHSHAQIVRTVENGRETGARAVLTVSGKSGEANRRKFGEIFGDSVNEDATASGKWTLSAPVPLAAIHDLEKNNKELRQAPTLDAKMKVYAEFVEKNGAQMLGGQVGITSDKWDLELKGDENFPGEAGRRRLNQLGKDLRAKLKTEPTSADGVVSQVTAELAKLEKRKREVGDEKKYTDLPKRLRDEQVIVIGQHITDLTGVKNSALAVAMRERPTADAASAGVQKSAAESEAASKLLDKEIWTKSKALGRIVDGNGPKSLRPDRPYNEAWEASERASDDFESVRRSEEGCRARQVD